MGIYDWHYTPRVILENRRKHPGRTVEWVSLAGIFHYRCSYELQGVCPFILPCLPQIGRADRAQRRIASWYIKSTSIHNVRRDGSNNDILNNPNYDLSVRS